VKLKKNNLTIFFLPVLFLLFFSCSKEKIITQDKLVQIYSDMLIAQDTVSLSSAGLDSLREAVLKKYNVTDELYKKTLDYYNRDSDRWEDFFNKVIAHVENLSQPSPKERAP
jgi:hypothetical protein